LALERAQPRGRYFVEALGRGLALLDCFIDDPRPRSLIELSREVGLGMPTTLRLIRTLAEAGYVRQDADTKRYRLSWKMLQRSVALPRSSRDGQAAACVVVVRAGMTTREMERDLLPALLETARAISAEPAHGVKE
jgi:DNA-binding IclR family transcriptional regulator